MKMSPSGKDLTVRVLVAEDSPTQAERIRGTLEDCGYEVFLVRNGMEALERARELSPTLIISDVVMPGMDGYELCRRIKHDAALRNIPVMLLTSLSDPVDVVRGLECGADNFVVKPYDDRYLTTRISYMLANRSIHDAEFTRMGVEILFAGSKYFITSDRLQILNLLLSTYETAVQKNQELLRVQEQLRELNERLDEKVRERTIQLEAEVEIRRKTQAELERVLERERALSKQLQQAQKMEAIGRLAGGVAHDFNNLLNVVIGCADLAREVHHSDQYTKELLTDVIDAGRRGAALTKQLLTFSRRSVTAPEALSLNDLAFGMEKMLRRLIGEDVELVIKTDPQLHEIVADPTNIEQILLNLAINSRDAMPLGGKLVIETTQLTLDEPFVDAHLNVSCGEYALLSVTDTGTGMTPEVKAHLFEPFFTTKEVGKGTGLGLATTYGIVNQCGGTITVYSEVGMGTTFRIYLPSISGHPVAVQARIRQEAQTPMGSEMILLAEDEPSVRRLTRRVLEARGYTVLEAASGEEALRIVDEFPKEIHLLLTDVVMPRLGGSQLTAAVRERRPNIKVLFMSGYTDDSILRYGVDNGEHLHLQKPFTPGELARRVRQTLDS